MALTTTIARTWEYPLQATTFSMKYAEDIMKPAYGPIIAKMGANRHIPLEYRYAPREMNGLGLPYIYTLQGISHIKTLVGNMGTGNKLAKLLKAQLDTSSIKLGTETNIFDLDFKTGNTLLTKCWIKLVWEFTCKYNI